MLKFKHLDKEVTQALVGEGDLNKVVKRVTTCFELGTMRHPQWKVVINSARQLQCSLSLSAVYWEIVGRTWLFEF